MPPSSATIGVFRLRLVSLRFSRFRRGSGVDEIIWEAAHKATLVMPSATMLFVVGREEVGGQRVGMELLFRADG
jgi:hypothetical protein